MMHRSHHYEEQAEDLGRRIGQRADDLHDAASSRARELADSAAQQARHVKAQAREWAERQSRRARDGIAYLHDGALAVGKRADRYVHDEPVKTALAAAAVGAAIGGLLVWLLRDTPRR
jgi:ElaB/YqjD/DUF883 family membrane-anchored ribosome-binding protein